VFLLIPVLFLNEKKYTVQGAAHPNFRESLRAIAHNQPFRIFAASYFLYWVALTFIQSGIIYYVTVLFGLEKSFATYFGMICFLSSFLLYPFLAKLERDFSKKVLLLAGFLIYGFIFLVILLPISGLIRFGIVSIVAAFPLAIFGILPNTVVADIVYQNEIETGKNQAGMFFAMAAFMMKVGISIANLIFPSLLIFGKSTDAPLGVQLTVVVALVFCLLGFWTFKHYKIVKISA
jgi:glycoside/pentoside/hexuronide:cation symporter, GPH family